MSTMLPEGWIARSLPLTTSIGADDSVTVRSERRVPVMITSSSSLPEPALPPGAPPGCWAKADGLAVMSAAAAAARINNGFILDLP
ncbi:MAG: hypothetical protein E6K27_16140 [Gammaproteobacteria bacterium]|nr:MAG: hypothetical protein E6K27_16140 [Gammaproteobacteria bacterium]